MPLFLPAVGRFAALVWQIKLWREGACIRRGFHPQVTIPSYCREWRSSSDIESSNRVTTTEAILLLVVFTHLLGEQFEKLTPAGQHTNQLSEDRVMLTQISASLPHSWFIWVGSTMENDWGDGLTGEDWASILETEAPSSGSSFFESQYEGLSWSGSGTSGMTSSSQPSLKNYSKDSTHSVPKSTSGTSSTPSSSSSSSAAAAKPATQQPLRKSCELCRSRKKKCDGDGLNRCRYEYNVHDGRYNGQKLS